MKTLLTALICMALFVPFHEVFAPSAQASDLGNLFTENATLSLATTFFSGEESNSEGLRFDKAFKLDHNWTFQASYKTSSAADLSGFGIHRKLFGDSDMPWAVTLGGGPGATELLQENTDFGGFVALGVEVADFRFGFEAYWAMNDVTSRNYRPTGTFRAGVMLSELPSF